MKDMKYIRLISLLVMLAGSIFASAQEYIVTQTLTEQRCIMDLPYTWQGKFTKHIITESGTYNDTTVYADPNLGITGEIVQLKITFTEHLKFKKSFQIKKGQTVEFRGKTYDTEGTFTDKKPSATACDTTFTITIAWSNDYHFYETADICKTDIPYEWRGQKYYYTGEYKKTYQTKDNKNDSTYHLTLNVHIPSEQTKSVTVCEDELPYKLGSQEIWEEGTYTDTLHPAYGCLEIVHVKLSIAPRPYTKLEVVFCQNEGYKHDSTVYHDRHTFLDTIHRVSGCDSIVETTCIPLPTYNFITRGGHRPGESYVWDHNGKTYTKDGNYYESYKTKAGCDSIYSLYLTTTYETPVHIQVCQGDEVFHHGKPVTEKTVFPIRDTLSSILGGDSILLVTYQFMPRYYFIERTTLCHGDTVSWTGHTDLKGNQIILQEEGAYFDRKKTQFGCDSIYEMQVTIMPKYGFDTTIVVCNDSLPYIWTDAHGNKHEWWKNDVDTTLYDTLGHTPVLEVDEYRDSIWYRALSGGCDSTWQMRLIVKDCGNDTAYLCPGSAVWVNSVKYTKTGDYTQCVQSSIPEACDSICRVHIAPAEPFNSEYYKPVQICQSELPYLWSAKAYGKIYSKELSTTGKYDLNLRTIDGCDSIIHIDFTVLPTYQIVEPTRRICRGDTTYINRTTTRGEKEIIPIWQDTTLRDTLYTQNGCDSIIIYTVNQVRDFFFDYKDHFRKDSTYWWHRNGDSVAITKPGVYFDSCLTVDGCDSIYRLTLTEDQPRYYSIVDSVCTNDLPYRWHGKEFFTDTFAIDSMKSPLGMDSVFEITLKVLPQFESDEYISLCSGQSFTFRERPVSTSGTYIDTLVAVNGCDSLVRYHVNIFPNHLIDETVKLGIGMSYTWVGHGITVSKPGWYFDSLQTKVGCDSIYRLHVIEDKSFLKGETMSICASDTPYEWHGQLLSKTGTYYDRYEVRPGVDSSYYINFTVKPTYLFESSVDLCAGGSYPFFGRVLTESGVYEEHLISTLGCDSIYRVTINRLPSILTEEKYTICMGETITIADTTVSNSCKFLRKYPSSIGCDSVVRFTVHVLPSYKKTSSVTICQGKTYTWHREHRSDTILTTPGVYTDVYSIAAGCDSVFELVLNMKDKDVWDTVIYVCSDETYFYKGKEYSTSQDFHENYVNRYGCDSIRVYHYKMMPYCTPNEIFMHCKGSSVIIGGRNYTEDGDYRIVINKDTLHRFSLAAYPTYERFITLSPTCDSLEYAGEMYYARVGSPTFVVDRYLYTTEHNCDSVEHVTMTIYKSSPQVKYKQTIYDYEYMIFGNEYYSTSGTYIHRNRTIFGCDSTTSLELTVIPTEHPGSVPFFYCALSPEPLKVFGKTFRPTKDTIIFDTVYVPYTDLKIVRKAEVTVEEAFYISKIEPDQDVCADNDIQFNIAFTCSGAVPKKYTFKFLANDLTGLPRIQSDVIDPYSKTIHINMTGQGSCVRPGTYPYELYLQGDQCSMSDTRYEGEIMVRYPESIMEANWDNVVALYNETKNIGEWVFEPPYTWQVWNKYGEDKTALVAPLDPSQPYLYSNNLTDGDTVVVTLRREGYKKAIPSCKFVFQRAPYTEEYDVIVTPTSARKSTYVSIRSNSDGHYRMIDNSGHIYQSGIYHSGEQLVQLPASAGCYLIQLLSDQTASKTQKIIVY